MSCATIAIMNIQRAERYEQTGRHRIVASLRRETNLYSALYFSTAKPWVETHWRIEAMHSLFMRTLTIVVCRTRLASLLAWLAGGRSTVPYRISERLVSNVKGLTLQGTLILYCQNDLLRTSDVDHGIGLRVNITRCHNDMIWGHVASDSFDSV